MSSACVLAIVAAWTIMFLRVVVMVRLVNASLAAVLGLQLPLSLVNHLWYKRALAASPILTLSSARLIGRGRVGNDL
jgi:hypothetical protein